MPSHTFKPGDRVEVKRLAHSPVLNSLSVRTGTVADPVTPRGRAGNFVAVDGPRMASGQPIRLFRAHELRKLDPVFAVGDRVEVKRYAGRPDARDFRVTTGVVRSVPPTSQFICVDGPVSKSGKPIDRFTVSELQPLPREPEPVVPEPPQPHVVAFQPSRSPHWNSAGVVLASDAEAAVRLVAPPTVNRARTLNLTTGETADFDVDRTTRITQR